MSSTPVLIVHGLWDSARRIEPLARGLRERGIEHVVTFDLKPNDGRAPIPTLALQVQSRVDAMRERFSCTQIDVVGFSMGALTTRYYLQRCGGSAHVRRFVSISGPHAGTWMAYALPLAGTRQMRPGSELLRDLDADTEPFGGVEVHCLYTPFDMMIRPTQSSVLRSAHRVHALRVPMHRMMITSQSVFDLVAQTLRGEAAGRP